MPTHDQRRTKIIATLGPATESKEMLVRLIQAGVAIFRLNMAHATHEWTRTVIRRIRAASQEVGQEVAIMMDIKGPEIRTGDVAAPIELQPGEVFDFTVKPGATRTQAEEVRSVDVNYRDLVKDISVGDTVLVDNGLIRLEVLEKNDTRIRCRVLTPGQLASRRHINLPGVKVNLPAFTEKDRADALLGLEEGIDYIAQSFVREVADIELVRNFLRVRHASVRIIAKIEDQSAIENLDEIVQASDALMIARGDLGIECPFEELPIIQRQAVRSCLAHGRPVIIATHILESMIEQPMPTRAEVTDAANAVFEQADCVMLSGETTVGRHPLECVKTLDTISRRIEQVMAEDFAEPMFFTEERMKLFRSAIVMANEMPGSALVAFTRQGSTAFGLAALRPARAPILAFTNSRETLRQLHLARAVEPIFLQFHAEPDQTIGSAINHLQASGRIAPGARLIVVSDIISHDRRVPSIQLRILPS
ncbi:MAG: pyruvate kinase [Opitutaceae bacterium]|nr:pyruvate kinase [Opitutaceae bacterium]